MQPTQRQESFRSTWERGSGHVWQGRFKSFPIQRNEHLITVVRYVLQNPVRAGLCASAKEWNWSSLRRTEFVDAWPVDDQNQWLRELEQPLPGQQLDSVRECVNRQRPFGRTDWQREIARAFGLQSTLRARGRPKDNKDSSEILGLFITKIEAEQPDLIFMDLDLPDVDGIKTTAMLRRNPKTSHIPVIALTAWISALWQEKAGRVSITTYLIKPISPQVFGVKGNHRGIHERISHPKSFTSPRIPTADQA